jgi:hypothetical protein
MNTTVDLGALPRIPKDLGGSNRVADFRYWQQVLPKVIEFGTGLTVTVSSLTSAVLGNAVATAGCIFLPPATRRSHHFTCMHGR